MKENSKNTENLDDKNPKGFHYWVKWAIYILSCLVGLLVVFLLGCYIVSWGLSFFNNHPKSTFFRQLSSYQVSDVFGILSTLIALLTLVVGVGAFFGYASLKDIAERKAEEVAIEEAHKIASQEAYTAVNDYFDKKYEQLEMLYRIKESLSPSATEQERKRKVKENSDSVTLSDKEKSISILDGKALDDFNNKGE